jgi:hypothetical protein
VTGVTRPSNTKDLGLPTRSSNPFDAKREIGRAYPRRTPVARVSLGRDELVVSLDGHGNVDLRLWTDTGGIHFPSKSGITFPRERLDDLIDALQGARKDGQAIA